MPIDMMASAAHIMRARPNRAINRGASAAGQHRADREAGAVQAGNRPAGVFVVAQQRDRRRERVQEVAVHRELQVDGPGQPIANQDCRCEVSLLCQDDSVSGQFRHDVVDAGGEASTSDGSMAGNIAMRNWLRPSLR